MQGERSGPIYCLNRDGMWVWVECVTARLSMSTAKEVHTETILADASLNIHWTESLCVCACACACMCVCTPEGKFQSAIITNRWIRTQIDRRENWIGNVKLTRGTVTWAGAPIASTVDNISMDKALSAFLERDSLLLDSKRAKLAKK